MARRYPKKKKSNEKSSPLRDTTNSLMDMGYIEEVLKNLYKTRLNDHDNWEDDEQEGKYEDYRFKNSEALHALLLPVKLQKLLKRNYDESVIQNDIDNLVEGCIIIKDQKCEIDFSPGVLFATETKDNFVDFASTAIRLFMLVKYLGYENNKKTKIDQLINLTVDAIIKTAEKGKKNFGHGWPCILNVGGKKNIKNEPDTYFTSSAMIALCDVVALGASPLSQELKNKCKESIMKGAYWLEHRFDGKLCTNNESNPTSSITSYTYAMIALLTCWEYLDEKRKSVCKTRAKEYIETIESLPTIAPKIHHQIFVADYKKATSYEDRSSIGNVLTVLSNIKHRFGNEDDFNNDLFKKVMDRVYRDLFNDQHMELKLWPSSGWRIYSTYRAIEGLLHHYQFARSVPLRLTEADIMKAVTEVLNSKETRNAIVEKLRMINTTISEEEETNEL